MPNNSASQSSLREASIFAPSGFAFSIVRDTKLCTITSFDEYVKRLALNI